MAATEPNPIKIFYSYASEDREQQKQLDIHLRSLEREGKIITWYDTKIQGGMEPDTERNRRLNTADLILLLISPDFIASDERWEKEIQQAMHRHDREEARVIPIILRPTDWQQAPFGKLQALPKDGKPISKWENGDEAFNSVAKDIREVVETLIAEKKVVKPITESPTERLPNIVPKPRSRNFPTAKLYQLIIALLLIMLIIIGPVIFILVRTLTANTHATSFVNASATAKANAHATATADIRATASIISANPNANSTPIPFNTVDATFYSNPKDSGKVDFNTATQGVFSLSFPNISFNPSPDMQHCNPPTTVDVNTRPFTDILQNADGSCKTIQVKDNSGNQAGVSNLNSFEAKFVAIIDLPSAGQLTTNISADDGWIFCMDNKNLHGPKPTPDPHNIMTNPPTSHLCPGLGLPEMADNNAPSSPSLFTISMNIPDAGSYVIELDYTECCGSQLTLVVNPFFMQTIGGS